MPIYATADSWVLLTAHSAYALGVADGQLLHRRWGARLPDPQAEPPATMPREWASFNPPQQLAALEYPGDADRWYGEPALTVRFSDGVRDTRLRFVAATVDGEMLTVELTCPDAPLNLTLRYLVHPDLDLIERSAVVSNPGPAMLTIERASAATLNLSGADYRLTHLSGRWYSEVHVHHERLPRGTTLLESRRLASSHQHAPYAALDRDATEETGEVFFAALAWSGSWRLTAETTEWDQTWLNLGVNDWRMALELAPGASYATPVCYLGYAPDGFGGAGRRMQQLVRTQLLRDRAPQKVIYNSWEATLFAIDARQQVELATLAQQIGVEVFVVDDGWFHRRDSDATALGDWWPDARKFPDGLDPLIRHVTGLGMEFGLWIEPEMVSPDSDLYRAHPDWALHAPGRPRTTQRNQLILDMTRAEVQDYLIQTFDALLAAHDIAYVKWDMNRNVGEALWGGDLAVRYIQGLYRVWGELRARHPRVTWLSCSGGGGRADLGILRVADRVQISDNTDPLAILRMQDGYSYYLPAETLESAVSDLNADHLALSYRFRAAFGGIMVVGANLSHWDAATRAAAAEYVSEFKQVRHLVHGGTRYRLIRPDGPFAATMFVAPDQSEALLLAFRSLAPLPTPFPALRLRGLDPAAHYALDGGETRSGAAWMTLETRLTLANGSSAMLRFWRV